MNVVCRRAEQLETWPVIRVMAILETRGPCTAPDNIVANLVRLERQENIELLLIVEL